MPTTNLDLPLMPSAEQIRRREFATIRRGYDPEQVRDYLLQIAVQVETLEKELREARLRDVPAVQKQGVDPYERLAERVAEVLRAADERADRLVGEAHDEAARLLRDARSEADVIRVDAQARAEEARHSGAEALRSARSEAERLLSSLASRREALVEELKGMQSRLLAVVEQIGTALDDADGDASSERVDASHAEPEHAPARAPEPGPDVPPPYEDMWVSSDTMTLDVEGLGLDDPDQRSEGES